MTSRRTRLLLFVVLAALFIAAALAGILLRNQSQEQVSIPTPAPSGLYEVRFTTPQRTGTPPSGSSGRLDERLVEIIDAAQQSVDVAAYDFGLQNVADALIRARDRGVDVRIVTDTDNLENEPLQAAAKAGIPIVDDQRGALMHHKFAVIDGRIVVTGAWNFAERDTFRHNNNTVVFDSAALARNFTNEFEKMFDGHAFGPTKPKDVPNPVIEQSGTRIETRFASEQEVVPAILDRLEAAQSSIVFMAFSFTLDDVGMALLERGQDGVGVWGVVESTGSQTQFSEFSRLKGLSPDGTRPPFPGCDAGPPVLQDGNPFLMHHKVFVIDERTVIVGSFNFTANAADDNDEALLIVDDAEMARQFLAEFCRVYNVAVEREKAGR
ncbi:MAG: phosphatidylserine/phosphatidylglycerophosphate/cardiolipin synthase family protein [Dehalococcoidia bacterium]